MDGCVQTSPLLYPGDASYRSPRNHENLAGHERCLVMHATLKTPMKRMVTSQSQLICDIGRTTEMGPRLEMRCPKRKTRTSDRFPEVRYQGRCPNQEMANSACEDGVNPGSDGNGWYTIVLHDRNVAFLCVELWVTQRATVISLE